MTDNREDQDYPFVVWEVFDRYDGWSPTGFDNEEEAARHVLTSHASAKVLTRRMELKVSAVPLGPDPVAGAML